MRAIARLALPFAVSPFFAFGPVGKHAYAVLVSTSGCPNINLAAMLQAEHRRRICRASSHRVACPRGPGIVRAALPVGALPGFALALCERELAALGSVLEHAHAVRVARRALAFLEGPLRGASPGGGIGWAIRAAAASGPGSGCNGYECRHKKQRQGSHGRHPFRVAQAGWGPRSLAPSIAPKSTERPCRIFEHRVPYMRAEPCRAAARLDTSGARHASIAACLSCRLVASPSSACPQKPTRAGELPCRSVSRSAFLSWMRWS
jgi:hypothetical protein